MGAPIGNKNAGKGKPWTDAIRRAIARRDVNKPEEYKYLNILADQLLEDCLNSETVVNRPAREELFNRLDGKYPQPIVGDDDNPLQMIGRIELVAPDGNSKD